MNPEREAMCGAPRDSTAADGGDANAGSRRAGDGPDRSAAGQRGSQTGRGGRDTNAADRRIRDGAGGAPYVVGITGAYAAGKSTVARSLEEAFAGAGVLRIDVDCVGHEVLEDCSARVAARFEPEAASRGTTILAEPAATASKSGNSASLGVMPLGPTPPPPQPAAGGPETRKPVSLEPTPPSPQPVDNEPESRGQAACTPFSGEQAAGAAESAGVRIDRKALGRLVFGDPGLLTDLEAMLHPEIVARVRKRAAEFGGSLVLVDAALLFALGLEDICGIVVVVDAPAVLRVFRGARRDRISLLQALRRIGARAQRVFRRRATKESHVISSNADIRRVANWGGKRAFRRGMEVLETEIWKKIRALSSSYR